MSKGRRHSVRPSRSNPIRIGKGLALEGRLGSMFFFLSTGRVTLLHESGFLHIKGIKTFGYESVIEKESEKILEKHHEY